MNRYIIAEKHSVENHAGSKARNDIERGLEVE